MLTLGNHHRRRLANYAGATYWSWDPKETWSLIVWFIYAAFLHARFTRWWVSAPLAGSSASPPPSVLLPRRQPWSFRPPFVAGG